MTEAPDAVDDAGRTRVVAFVRGEVQGVGFRWWTRAAALELGLVGHARNLDDGRVEVVAEGPVAAVDALVAALEARAGDVPGRLAHRPGRVTGVSAHRSRPLAGRTLRGFEAR